MIERLKQPFWFGLPLYAWLAGGAALVLGVGYFAFFARAQAAATTPQTTDTGSSDPLNPYPSTDPGAGATEPPAAAFAPAGTVVYSQPSASMLQPAALTTPSAQVMASVVPPSRTTATAAATSSNVARNAFTSILSGFTQAIQGTPYASTAARQRTGPQSQ